jgi:hypothetical protein
MHIYARIRAASRSLRNNTISIPLFITRDYVFIRVSPGYAAKFGNVGLVIAMKIMPSSAWTGAKNHGSDNDLAKARTSVGREEMDIQI